MNQQYAIKVLEGMQEMDKAFAKKMFEANGAATFCADCHKNTATGLRPFWHRFARVLCPACGEEYEGLLKNMKTVDI